MSDEIEAVTQFLFVHNTIRQKPDQIMCNLGLVRVSGSVTLPYDMEPGRRYWHIRNGHYASMPPREWKRKQCREGKCHHKRHRSRRNSNATRLA